MWNLDKDLVSLINHAHSGLIVNSLGMARSGTFLVKCTLVLLSNTGWYFSF